MGRTSLRPWFMGNKMQFEAVACRLFLHYSYTSAQKASNYGIFCFYNKNTIDSELKGSDFNGVFNYGLEGGAFLILGGATTALGGALLYPWGQQ